MICHEGKRDHFAAELPDNGGFRHRFDIVVAAFGMKTGFYDREELFGGWLIENRYVVHAAQGRKEFRPLRFRHEGARRAFQAAGAFIGIALGIALGNLFGLLLHTRFVIPWNWMAYGILICTIVGLTAGLYPAVKAGNLNPIEALHYE